MLISSFGQSYILLSLLIKASSIQSTYIKNTIGYQIIAQHMLHQKYESILREIPNNISRDELGDFETYCLLKNLTLKDYINISRTIYKCNPELVNAFLKFVKSEVIQKDTNDDKDKEEQEKCNRRSLIKEYKIELLNLELATSISQLSRSSHSQQMKEKQLQEIKYNLCVIDKMTEEIQIVSLLNQAYFSFYSGDFQKAINIANKVYEQENKNSSIKLGSNRFNAAAMMLLAQIHFAKKSYSKSLEYYKKMLQIYRSLPVKARLGMAYCYYNLNMFEMAQACFERILYLQTYCCQALIGLAVIYERRENYERYFYYIQQAYHVNPNHPLMLLHFAQHYLITGNFGQAKIACLKGLSNITAFPRLFRLYDGHRDDSITLQARLNNIMGQISYGQKKYEDSIRYYGLACGKGLMWNQLGLAQCYALKGDYKEAFSIVEYIQRQIDHKKDDGKLVLDCMKFIAYLKMKLGDNHKSTKDFVYYYQEALTFDRNDIDLKHEMAFSLASIDSYKSYNLFSSLLKQEYPASAINQKFILLINAGVISLENKNEEEGQMYLMQALKLVQNYKEINEDETDGFEIIILYNLAICLENQQLHYQAIGVHQQIIIKNPLYLDSYLRKAYILSKLGNVPGALYILDQASKICLHESIRYNKMDKILNLKAYIQYSAGKSEQALETLNKMAKKDNYDQLLKIAIKYYKFSIKQMKNQTFQQFMEESTSICQSICDKDETNVFAYISHGILSILSNKMAIQKAFEYFKIIKEKSKHKISSVFYNIGLLNLSNNDRQNALLTFNQYRDRTQNKKADQIICYINMINQEFKKSASQVKKSIFLDPSNYTYRFQLVLHNLFQEETTFSQNPKQKIIKKVHYVRKCLRFYEHIVSNDLINNTKIAQRRQLDEKFRFSFNKIQQICQETLPFLNNIKALYDKKKSQYNITAKEEKEGLENIHINFNTGNYNIALQVNLQQRLKKQEEHMKRQLALANARKQNEKMSATWDKMKRQNQGEQIKRKPSLSSDILKQSLPKKKKKPAVKAEYIPMFGMAGQGTQQEINPHPSSSDKDKQMLSNYYVQQN